MMVDARVSNDMLGAGTLGGCGECDRDPREELVEGEGARGRFDVPFWLTGAGAMLELPLRKSLALIDLDTLALLLVTSCASMVSSTTFA